MINKKIAVVLVIFISGLHKDVDAYKRDTHADMSGYALQYSALGADPGALEFLGLQSLVSEAFQDSEGGDRTIRGLIKFGAKAEDNVPRPVNHFFDPVRGRGLTIPFKTFFASPDWALQDNGVVPDDEQQFSYKKAKAYYRTALTTKDPDEFRRMWGLTFQTLGQVIHHIQDMAQPEHVRNDKHLDVPLPGLFDPSLYESYTNALRNTPAVKALLSDRSYPPVAFSFPRFFWTMGGDSAGAGRGIAEFTNRNFVSKDTNFRILNGAPAANAEYSSPVPGPSALVPLTELLPDRGGTLCELMGNDPRIVIVAPDTNCSVEFFESQVTDIYTGETLTNPRASSLSIFDQYLRTFDAGGVSVQQFGSGDLLVTVDRVFTLNRFNYDEFHKFLLPRAVAYSAGLIDHFFRGRLKIALPDDGVYAAVDHSTPLLAGFTTLKLKLKNVSAPVVAPQRPPVDQDLKNGQLRAVVHYVTNPCYRDDLSGEFNKNLEFPSGDCDFAKYFFEGVPGATVSAPIDAAAISADDFTDLTFDFSADPIPIGVRDVVLQVVFTGNVGSESDGIAVGFKNISEPTYITLFNNTDYFGIDGVLHTPDEIRSDPDLLARVDLNGDGIPDFNIDPQPLVNVRFGIGGSVLTEAGQLEPLHYFRIAVLAEADQADPFRIRIPLRLQYQFPDGVLALSDTNVTPLQNQLTREPTLGSFILNTRGFFRWFLFWISKGIGVRPPNDAIESLPALSQDPGPTPIGVLFQ